jgi:hypothetical protein
MFVTGAKLIGAGLATISLLGSGIGISDSWIIDYIDK